MKKLIIALMVLSTVVSCGKNNSIGTAATTSVTNPITTTVQGASQLGSLIDNYTTQFGTGQVQYQYYTYNWNRLTESGMNLVYRYTKTASTSGSTGSNCERKWGIFYVCSYSNTTSTSNVVESRKKYNNEVVVLDKMNELKGYINNANPLIPISASGTSYLITMKDGRKVIIDTRYPLQANPIGIMDSTGTEYLYNITEN